MEFGIRGIAAFAGKPTIASPATGSDGTGDLARTNIAASSSSGSISRSAQLGFTGSAKWDAYWGKYDADVQLPLRDDRARRPRGGRCSRRTTRLRLLLQTTQQGWQVLQVAPWDETTTGCSAEPDQPEKEIAAYADDGGHLTLMGLDSHGRDLNAVSADPAPAYSIGGLPASTSFNLALWNAAGDGQSSLAGTTSRRTPPASRASRCRCTRRSR